MQNTVIGVYDNYSQAQAAVNELTARGFKGDRVKLTPEQESHEARSGALTNRAEHAGWSLGNFFRSLFGTDEDASHSDVYHEAVRRGSYLVTVEADSDEQRDQACEVLNRFSPVDIDERSSQWRSKGWSAYDRGSAAYTDDEVRRERSVLTSASPSTSTKQNLRGGKLEGEARLPVVEEELRVGKRTVQRGGVRIVSRVSERPVEESVHLRDEKVNVQRRPVNKPATEADLAAFKEGSMELRETAEEPVVSKSARVVEEVVVNKDVRERDEKVKDTVRRTDVDVQQMGAEATAAAPGGTVRGRTGTTGMMGTDDFRSHWQSSFASQGGRYEDYEPAYRYGSELRSNQTYHGRAWNDIEPEVRRDWESRHAGSPWERAKDAVRHAWERVTD